MPQARKTVKRTLPQRGKRLLKKARAGVEKVRRVATGGVQGRNVQRQNRQLTGMVKALQKKNRRLRARESLFLKEKKEVLGTIASALGHTINNPMTSVVGNAEMAAMEIHDPAIKKNLEEISRSGMRASGVLNRISSGVRAIEKPFKPEPTAMNGLVEHSLKRFGNLKEKNVYVSVKGFEKLLEAEIDSEKTSFIIDSLLTNSVEELEQRRGGKIAIRAGLTSDGKNVSISVSDNGGGIHEGLRSQVFQGLRDTMKHGGSGLSLMMSKALAREQGGNLRLSGTSNEFNNHGTTFTVILPIKQPKA